MVLVLVAGELARRHEFMLGILGFYVQPLPFNGQFVPKLYLLRSHLVRALPLDLICRSPIVVVPSLQLQRNQYVQDASSAYITILIPSLRSPLGGAGKLVINKPIVAAAFLLRQPNRWTEQYLASPEKKLPAQWNARVFKPPECESLHHSSGL